MVVDAAEAIVNQTPGFENKHGVAVNKRVIGNQIPVEVRELDWEHLVQMAEHHYDAGHSILILYRKRDTKKDAKAKLSDVIERAREDKRDKAIKFLTYHSSKGLQADAVFLLGIARSPHHRLRETISMPRPVWRIRASLRLRQGTAAGGAANSLRSHRLGHHLAALERADGSAFAGVEQVTGDQDGDQQHRPDQVIDLLAFIQRQTEQ